MNYLFKPPLWAAILMMGLYLAGCEKETDNPVHTVSGKVLEYGTKKPVANASIYVLKYFGTLLGPEGFSLLDSTKTDATGKYTFKTPAGNFIFVNVAKQGYFKIYSSEYASIKGLSSTQSSSVTQDIVIDPIGWLKIHVKNVKPVADNDMIELTGCEPNPIRGKQVDTFTKCLLRGNRKINFTYIVHKTTPYKLYQDSIYIKGLDTTYYSINY